MSEALDLSITSAIGFLSYLHRMMGLALSTSKRRKEGGIVSLWVLVLYEDKFMRCLGCMELRALYIPTALTFINLRRPISVGRLQRSAEQSALPMQTSIMSSTFIPNASNDARS